MRLSSAEIDQGILDVAAGIFAQHGFAQTSVQQVADAVGYSKPGLLHRFGSKEAMFRSGYQYGVSLVEQVLTESGEIPFDENRTRRILELLCRTALQHPGLIGMLIRSFEAGDDDLLSEEMRILGYKVLALLDPPFGSAEQRLRVVLAGQLIVNAATAQHKRVDFDVFLSPDDLVELVVDLSLQILGVPQPAVAGAR